MAENKVFFDTTHVALEILMRAVEKTVKKEVLTEDELKLTGRAIGWLALMTVGTDNDILETLIRASDEVKLSSKKIQYPKSTIPINQSTVAAYGGKRKKMKGGVGIVSLIVGAIAIIYGGNTATNIYTLQNNREIIRNAGISQINEACPNSLSIGLPSKPLIDWNNEYADAVAKYEHDKSICEATKTAVNARITQAENKLNTAWKKIPNDAAIFATTAALVTNPLTAANPAASLTAASLVGKATQEIVQSVISGQLPDTPEKLDSFVTTLSKGFPEAKKTTSETPVSNIGATSSSSQSNGGKRNKTRRSMKNKRITRRR